jgi:hypothetical protein
MQLGLQGMAPPALRIPVQPHSGGPSSLSSTKPAVQMLVSKASSCNHVQMSSPVFVLL